MSYIFLSVVFVKPILLLDEVVNSGRLFEVQECSDKELSSLAKRALQLLNSAAPFDIDHIDGAVIAVLGAATDANWHTRVSALTFLQSLVYRYRR